MTEFGESSPTQDRVALSEYEKQESKRLLDTNEFKDVETKAVLEIQKEKKPVNRQDQISRLTDFCRARIHDLSKDTPKAEREKLEDMLDAAAELSKGTPESINIGETTALLRYVRSQREIFGLENEEIFNSYLDVIPYPYLTLKEAIKPNNVTNELQREEGPASFQGVTNFLNDYKKDAEAVRDTSVWQEYKEAVDAAEHFNKEQESTKRKKGEQFIMIVINDGVVAKRTWTTSDKADPSKGIYIFSDAVKEEDPLSLKMASYDVSQTSKYILDGIENAKTAINKLQNNEIPTINEQKNLYFPLNIHLDYYTENLKSEETSKELETLKAMLNFVEHQLGDDKRNAKEKEIGDQIPKGMSPADVMSFVQSKLGLAA